MSSKTSELKSFRKTQILKAGAGAGKTTTLVRLFLQYALDFYSDFGKFPKIVVSTFTRKATQELKERLAAKSLEMRQTLQENEADPQVVEKLFDYVSTKSMVHISTIHGVLAQFLVRYGHVIGLTPDFKIVDSQQLRRLHRRLLKEVIVTNETWKDLITRYDFSTLEKMVLAFSEAQWTFPHLHRANGEKLKEIRDQKWKALSDQAMRLCGEIVDCMDGGTKLGVYMEAYQRLPFSQGAEAVYAILCEDSTFDRKPPLRKKNPEFSEELNSEFDTVRKKIDEFCEDNGWSDEAIRRHEEDSVVFESLAHAFTEKLLAEKIQSGVLSMTDLELFSLMCLRSNPEVGKLFSREWNFWMIDEYQDTSPVQVELLNQLIGDSPAFYVGDPQQSIYLFRGARSKVFQDKVDEVLRTGGEFKEARINYRSHPDVLAMFNAYFPRLGAQFGTMDTPESKKDFKATGVALEFSILESKEEEDLAVIGRLQKLISEGVSPEEIVVLGRVRADIERLAHLAQTYGLPIQLHVGGSFYHRREVQDLLLMIKILLNPHDNVSFVSLCRSPWFFVDDAEIQKWCHRGSESYFTRAVAMTAADPQHPVQAMVKYQETSKSIGLLQTLMLMIREREVLVHSHFVDNTGRREANIWKLLSLVAQAEKLPGFNYLDFVNQQSSSQDTEASSEDVDATPVIEPRRINLMTVHASKGLQFKHVLIPWRSKNSQTFKATNFMVDENSGCWSIKVRDEASQDWFTTAVLKEIESSRREQEKLEADRVFYVAMTRAIASCSLFWTPPSKKNLDPAPEVFPFPLVEGESSLEGFRMLVSREVPDVQPLQKKEWEAFTAREKYTSEVALKQATSLSASEVLEKSIQSKNLTGGRNLIQALDRAQQGTDAHRVFEGLKYNSFVELKTDLDLKTQTALDFIVSCEEVPLYQIIQKGEAEWGFAVKHQGKKYQGQIDLWGILDDICYIIDYKTGSQKYSEQAFDQLRFYGWILNQMKAITGLKVQLVVVYPFDRVIKTEHYSSATDLEALVQKFIGSSI